MDKLKASGHREIVQGMQLGNKNIAAPPISGGLSLQAFSWPRSPGRAGPSPRLPFTMRREQSSSPAEDRMGRTERRPTQFRLTHLPVCEPDNFRPATNEHFEEDIAAAKSAIKVALPKQPSKPNGKVKHTWKAVPTLGGRAA